MTISTDDHDQRPASARGRAIIATGSGLFVSALVAILSRLDVQLVAAFRGTRTLPYRTSFFVVLGVVCAAWCLLEAARPRGLARAILVGAIAGYVSGLGAYFFVQYFLISAEGALRSLTSHPTAVLVPLGLPFVTFSWFFGAVACCTAWAVLRVGQRAA